MIQPRWLVLIFTIGALLFAVALVPCRAQTGSPIEPGDASHQTPSDTPAAMTLEPPPVLGIVIPRLPEAFMNSSDPNARRIIDMLDEVATFESSMFDPTAVFGESETELSTKSSAVSVGVIAPRAGCVEYSPNDWVIECDPVVRPGVVSCHAYQYNGSLCVEWFDSKTPLTWMVEIRLDGTSGSSTFENFVVQRWTRNSDHKYVSYSYRQHTEHPDLENGFADGPQDDWEFMVEGEATLYTPSGTTDLSTRVIKHRHHRFDFNDREFNVAYSSTLSCYPDGGFHSRLLCSNRKTKELYTCYVAYWKEDEGRWMTFDEAGGLTGSGEFE